MSRCFQVANTIREAPIHEMIWGLTKGGYPASMILSGIRNLQEQHYIALTDEWCKLLDISTINDTSKVWYMLADKWLNVLAGPGEIGKYPEVMFDTVRAT